MNKILSGKFIFTVVTAYAFLYATIAETLSPGQVHGIIMLVVAFYFNKREDNKNENKSSIL